MKPTTELKAIRMKCLDCSSYSAAEVRNCKFENCPLYPYRSGHNPNRKGVGNRNAQLPNSDGEKDTQLE